MTTPPPARTGHPYYMHDAILRQPAALAEMQDKHAPTVRPVAAELAAKRHIYIVGIGTSWHAVLVAEHWFRRLAGAAVPVDGCHSFEFCAYPPPLTGDDAVIVVSHRGTKTYSFLALELAKAQGAYTVSITSTAPGPRLQIADAELNTVEPELSAAFTVSYTAALTVLAMLAVETAAARVINPAAGLEPAQLRAGLAATPAAVSAVLSNEETIEKTARRFRDQRRFVSIGWGPNTANAYEAALKIKETSAVDCEGLQVEQLLHGPFCSIDDQCLLTLLAPPGAGYARCLDIARAAAAVNAPVWALVQEGDTELTALATESLPLPPLPEIWTPLAYVTPLQLFTYHLALARGKNPDRFQQDNPRQAAARTHYEL